MTYRCAAGPFRFGLIKTAGLVLALAVLGGCGSSNKPDDGNGPADEPADSPTAEEVLQRMIDAYRKAPSYADQGTLRFFREPDPKNRSRTVPFSVVSERPGKLRMELYQARIVVDQEKIHATLAHLPGSVLVRPAPEKLEVSSVCNWRILARDLIEVMVEIPPPLRMFLEENSVEALLGEAKEPTLVESKRIAANECYRVQAKHPDGTMVLWIDQQTYVLRRLVCPTDRMRRQIEQDEQAELKAVSLVADFTDARLGLDIDAKAFQFETPPDAEIVEFFVPPHPAQMLGKQVLDFEFLNLGGGKVTPESLAGKPVVLAFWNSRWKPSLDLLPSLDKLRRKYEDEGNVTFLAVSLDQPDVEDKKLREICDEKGLELPLARGPADAQFGYWELPAVFILDGKGVVQNYLIMPSPATLPMTASRILDELLAGEDTYELPLEIYQDQLKRRNEFFEQGGPSRKVEIAQRSDAATFRLTPLFKNTQMERPGNVLAIEHEDGPATLLVVDKFHDVWELGLDGDVIGKHEIDIDPMVEGITAMRTATAADGKRYYLGYAFSSWKQRCHLLDEKFDIVQSYPEDALENPHAGIIDVQLFDLDGDGKLNLYVGYWGYVGVQAASLEGKRVWWDRSISNVQGIAVGGPNNQGKYALLCVDASEVVTGFDGQGNVCMQRAVPDRSLTYLESADLDGDGSRELCALSSDGLGNSVAVGIHLDEGEIWSCPLPPGIHQCPIERIIPGRIKAEGPGVWLLPSADGSIHIVSADGEVLDQFQYGAQITGLATTELDGQPVLIVSSPGKVEAWKIE